MKNIKRKLAFLLASVMVLVSLPSAFVVSATEENGMPISDETISEHMLGDEILNYDFTTMTEGDAKPNGWIDDFNYANVGWSSDGKQNGLVTKDGYLLFDGSAGEDYVTLPAFGTENYMISMEVSTEGAYQGYGLVTGIPNDYENANSFVISKAHPGVYGTAGDHTLGMVTRYNTKMASSYELTAEQSALYFYDESGNIVEFLNTPDKKIKFSVTHYNGVNRFYMNGIFVYEMADYGTNEGLIDRAGIFTANADVKIYSLSVTELLPVHTGDVIYSYDYNDFKAAQSGDNLNILPEGFLTYHYPTNGLLWEGKENFQVLNQYWNLQFQYNTGGENAVTLPALGTEDYVLNVQIRTSSANDHSVALITDILNDYQNTQRATFSWISTDDSTGFETYIRKPADGDAKATYVNIGLTGKYFDDGALDLKETVDLTVTHYNDITHFYVNGIYVASTPDANGDVLCDRVAVMGCNATYMRINSVVAKKLVYDNDLGTVTKATDLKRDGDVNVDNAVNIIDLIRMKKIAAGTIKPVFAADLDFDNAAATSTDLIKLRKRLLGIENSTFYVANESEVTNKLKVQGRWETVPMGVTLDWTASAIEFSANCKGDVGIVLNTAIYDMSDNPSKVLHFTAFVDGKRIEKDFEVKSGATYLQLASGLAEGEHTFEIVRTTDAYFGTAEVAVIELEGTLNDNSTKNKMIEFIGDSITVGGGNLGTSDTPDDVRSGPLYQDGSKSYAYLAAKSLGYDYSISARSGIALYYGYGHVEGDSDTCSNFTDIYGIQNYYRNKQTEYVQNRVSDIICINLGTNDYWSGKVPDDASFATKMVEFVNIVKAKSPNAKVVLITGGITSDSVEAVSTAAATLGGEENGYYVCNLSYGLCSGAGNHPNVAQHEQMSTELTAFLTDKGLVE